MGSLVALIVAGHLWVHSHYTPREDYERHLADVACSKALSNYFDAKERAERYPEDKQAKKDLEEAAALRELACGKLTKG